MNRILNLIASSILLFMERFLSGKSLFIKKKSMLIIRLDAIGDYILFRNFIKEIKDSPKFSGYKISLLGNEKWRNIAETFDRSIIEKFIWAAAKRLKGQSNWKYRVSTMLKLHLGGYEIVLRPNDTKTKITDYIITHCGAEKILDNSSNSIFSTEELEIISSNGNIRNSNLDPESFFQFNRNRTFTEEITESKSNILRPTIEIGKNKNAGEYIVIFPGAGQKSRKWSAENFAVLCNKILEMKQIKIRICGNKNDRVTAKGIILNCKSELIEDLTGKTNLSELISVIANAKLLVSNETCAVHIGAAVVTNTICISNGNHFGRFNPYPEKMAGFIKTIYPQQILNEMHDYFALVKKYHINSDVNINKITPEMVFEECQNFFSEKENFLIHQPEL
ncbi:MAG: glycosyltransferase family 9 protein [bacterium]